MSRSIQDVLDKWKHHSAGSGKANVFKVVDEEIVDDNSPFPIVFGVQLSELSFNRCAFKQPIVFRDCTTPLLQFIECNSDHSIEIHDCTITAMRITKEAQLLAPFAVYHSTVDEFSVDYDSSMKGLLIKDSKLKILRINDSTLKQPTADQNNLTITSSEVGMVELNRTVLEHTAPTYGMAIASGSTVGALSSRDLIVNSIQLNHSTVLEEAMFSNIIFKELRLEEGTKVAHLELRGHAKCEADNIQCGNVSISGVFELNDMTVGRIHFGRHSDFNRVACRKLKAQEVELKGSVVREQLAFSDCELGALRIMSSAQVKELESVGNLVLTELRVEQSVLASIRLSAGSVLQDFTVERAPLPSGSIRGKLDKVLFKDCTSMDHTLAFNTVELTEFHAKSFFNHGRLSFADMQFPNRGGITLDGSDMGETSIVDLKLTANHYLRFRDSALCSVRLLNVSIARDILEVSLPATHGSAGITNPKWKKAKEGKTEHHARQERLAYSNFAQAYKRSEYFDKARLYTAEALSAHRRELWRTNRKPARQRANMVALWINGTSNGYGFDLSRATASLLLVPMAMFAIYCLILGLAPCWSSDCLATFNQVVLHYLKFAYTPLRPLDASVELVSLAGANIGLGAQLWDILSRVTSAYLMYQFVQAFRHFSRAI